VTKTSRRRPAALIAVAVLALAIAADASAAKQAGPRLDGFFDVVLTIAEDTSPQQQPGDVNERTWIFTPVCRQGACATNVVVRAGSQFVTVLLRQRGSVYRGSRAIESECVDTLVEVEVRVVASRRVGGALRATRIAGANRITNTPTGEAGCTSSPLEQLSAVDGRRTAQKPGARLEGTWEVGLEVTGGHFPELVGDPVGQTGEETWTFTPSCSRGACDVLLTITGAEDFYFPLTVYLKHRGNGLYEGRTPIADPLACGEATVSPGYLGAVTHSLQVTETAGWGRSTQATRLQATFTLRKDVTEQAIIAGCGSGYVESIRSYDGRPAAG
jgi:hypothetical protein